MTQTESSESSNKDENKTDDQCKKCVETCSVYTENDEKFKIRDMEFNKIEIVFKDKCKEMFENEKV
ncbi:hypothetical protein Hanom_Chr10g00944161 [Helianthus anomalus]